MQTMPRTLAAPPPRCPWPRTLAILTATMLLVGCAGLAPAPQAPPADGTHPAVTAQAQSARESYLARATQQSVTQGPVTVSVAALHDDEIDAAFGLPLAAIGVQPVWVRIENHGRHSRWLLPAFLDRDFYTAREVAHLLGANTGGKTAEAARDALVAAEMPLRVHAGTTASGFIYTNLTRGLKLVNIELLGTEGVQHFDFAREVPGGKFDYESRQIEAIYPADQRRGVSVQGLGAALAQLPCCTTNAAGTERGDPLNLVVVGSERDVLVALVRAGWDFTDTIDAGSVGHMVKAFIFGGAYRTSPVSALYYDGRSQDFAMQRARHAISQRSHLRLWITPLTVDGQPVWIGQVSRDIGVKATRHSPTFTTHVIDPNVDEAREYFLQSLLIGGNIARWGFVPGVGAAPEGAPRRNLGDDPYFTDGTRLVVFISNTPRTIGDAQYVKWPDPR